MWIRGGGSKSFIQEQKGVRAEEEEKEQDNSHNLTSSGYIVLTSMVQRRQHIHGASCLAMCRAS